MSPTAIVTSIRRQRGVSSLFITVILVLVVMLLAITASVLSNTQFKLAGNIQFENVATNLTEAAVASAENWLKTNARNAGFTTYSADAPYIYPLGYLTTNNIDPLTMTWTNNNSLAVGGDTNQRYVIEKYGVDNIPLGANLQDWSRDHAGCWKVDLYRISARGTSVKGTVKLMQTVYSVPSC